MPLLKAADPLLRLQICCAPATLPSVAQSAQSAGLLSMQEVWNTFILLAALVVTVLCSIAPLASSPASGSPSALSVAL